MRVTPADALENNARIHVLRLPNKTWRSDLKYNETYTDLGAEDAKLEDSTGWINRFAYVNRLLFLPSNRTVEMR